MSKNFQPHHDWVLIRREVDRVTKGGIVMPENAEEDPLASLCGRVVAVGPGVLLESGERVECQSVVGRLVEYSKLATKRVTVGEEELDTLRDINVYGFYEE